MATRVMVGVPAFNEQTTIRKVVLGAFQHADLVVVLDDGSTDATSAEAMAAGATVIRHQFNSGKGVAVASLFRHAIQSGSDVLVLIDADGQHQPDEIPALIDALQREPNADMVVGSRFHEQSESATPRIRRVGQIVFNSMTSVASGVYCSDSQSGFRAFRRRAFCSMHLSEASFSVESEMQFECRARNLRLTEVPISCSYEAPPKRNVLGHGLGVLVRLTRMTVRRRTLGSMPEAAVSPVPPTVLSLDRGSRRAIADQSLIVTAGD